MVGPGGLDEGDRPGQRLPVAGPEVVGQHFRTVVNRSAPLSARHYPNSIIG
jgi:hypothetical protein